MTRNFKEMMDGKILLITPEGDTNTTPLFCRVCELPMKTLEDSISFRQQTCCSKCGNRWSSRKEGNLKDGWSPDKQSEEWLEYIQERIMLGKSLINLK